MLFLRDAAAAVSRQYQERQQCPLRWSAKFHSNLISSCPRLCLRKHCCQQYGLSFSHRQQYPLVVRCPPERRPMTIRYGVVLVVVGRALANILFTWFWFAIRIFRYNQSNCTGALWCEGRRFYVSALEGQIMFDFQSHEFQFLRTLKLLLPRQWEAPYVRRLFSIYFIMKLWLSIKWFSFRAIWVLKLFPPLKRILHERHSCYR